MLNGREWNLIEELVEVESGKNKKRPKLLEAIDLKWIPWRANDTPGSLVNPRTSTKGSLVLLLLRLLVWMPIKIEGQCPRPKHSLFTVIMRIICDDPAHLLSRHIDIPGLAAPNSCTPEPLDHLEQKGVQFSGIGLYHRIIGTYF